MPSRVLTLATSTLIAVGGVVAVATPAQAATTVTKSGDLLTVQLGSPSEFLIEPVEGGFRVTSSEGLGAVTGCAEDIFGMMVCPGITRVTITGSSGDDSFSIAGHLDATVHAGAGNDTVYGGYDGVALTAFGESGNDRIDGGTRRNVLDGGDGDDEVHGGAANDTVSGGPGHDRISGDWGDDTLSGGPGNDKVIGDFGARVQQPQDGDDVLQGDDGDDILYGMGGGDTYVGGPGIDTASYEGQYPEGTDLVFSVTLDDQANDGVSGEGDNVDVGGTVEHLELPQSGVADMTVVGNDGPNDITAFSSRTLRVDGRGGDDRILVGAVGTGSRATVSGGAGDDVIDSHGDTSTVDGGPGNDTIRSGDGNDTVTGGSGRDVIAGGQGDDTIDSVDDEVDTVTCGTGADAARADRIDVVEDDVLSICESTTLVGTAPPSTSGTVTMRIPKRVRVSRKGVATFKARNTTDHRVTLKVVAKGKRFRIGTGRRTVRPDSTVRVKVKLTRKALRHLRRHHRLSGKVTARIVRGGTGRISRKVRFRMR